MKESNTFLYGSGPIASIGCFNKLWPQMCRGFFGLVEGRSLDSAHVARSQLLRLRAPDLFSQEWMPSLRCVTRFFHIHFISCLDMIQQFIFFDVI